MSRPGKIWVLVVAALLLPAGESLRAEAKADRKEVSTSGPEAAAAQAELEARLNRLIEQLGDEQFATREKAQAELVRLGLQAFDLLHKAQDHHDIEIALRARYLVRSMQIHWVRDTDPLEVRKILRNYADKDYADRQTLMERLARLENAQGVPALCRIVRFETANLLSKRAALLVVGMYPFEGVTDREHLAETIETAMGTSQRAAAEWLRTLAGTLKQPDGAIDRWDQITRSEELTLAQFPEQSSREIVRDLLRAQADLLREQGHTEESLVVVQRMLNLLDGTRSELIETVDWLIEREVWSAVDDLAERFPGEFNQFALLLYRLAEAQHRRGDEELANKTAERALALAPQDAKTHNEIGQLLWERGLYAWAEREFRVVMSTSPPGSVTDIFARLLISEMLHDLQREKEAGEALAGLVKAMDEDGGVLQTLQQYPLMREPGAIRSRMHYFYAQHHASQAGEQQQQIEHLEKGIQSDPSDADVLIAMYRLENPPEGWREKTLERIQQAADRFREEIRGLQRQVEDEHREPFIAYYSFELSRKYNQLAWLISNTEGDYDEALRLSQRSLELRPDNAGYLDTLGRCYYAVGDYEQAVHQQQRAVKLEPYSQQIRRQLEMFQEALAQQRAASAASNAP